MKRKCPKSGRVLTDCEIEVDSQHYFIWDDDPEVMCSWDDVEMPETFENHFLPL